MNSQVWSNWEFLKGFPFPIITRDAESGFLSCSFPAYSNEPLNNVFRGECFSCRLSSLLTLKQDSIVSETLAENLFVATREGEYLELKDIQMRAIIFHCRALN